MANYELYGIRHSYVEYNNGGNIAFLRTYLTKACDVKVSNTSLEFAGDGQKYKKNYGYEAEGQVEFEIDSDGIDAIIFGTATVAPLGGDDFAKRYYKGTDAEMQTTLVGLRITLDGADADTGAPIVVRFRVLRVQFSPEAPVKMGSAQVQGRMMQWYGRRTKTDIVGATPTGMPARGCFWIKDYITDATKFDPVPGDLL